MRTPRYLPASSRLGNHVTCMTGKYIQFFFFSCSGGGFTHFRYKKAQLTRLRGLPAKADIDEIRYFVNCDSNASFDN